MKAYKAIFNDDLEGVFGISLVESPAMEGQFIALSKDEIVQFKEVNKEQRILVGLVLEPNKPIYRNQNGNEFTIEFDEDTIKDLCYSFAKNKHNSNSAIEHENPIQGVTFVENWIVRDEEKDTSKAFGLSCKKGSWVSVLKVDSDEVWNHYVKEGKVLGFSIDAIIKLEEITKMSKQEEEKSFITQLKELFAPMMKAEKAEEAKKEEVKLGSVKLEDGSITLMYDGETLEVGTAVYTMTEDGEKVPAPKGEHKLEGGNILVIEEEGIAKEVKPMATEEPKEEEMESGTPAPDAVQEVDNEMEDLMNAIKKITVQYSKDQKKESETLVALKKEVDDLKAELVELKDQPTTKPKKSQPTQVEFSKMTELQKRKYYREHDN